MLRNRLPRHRWLRHLVARFPCFAWAPAERLASLASSLRFVSTQLPGVRLLRNLILATQGEAANSPTGWAATQPSFAICLGLRLMQTASLRSGISLRGFEAACLMASPSQPLRWWREFPLSSLRSSIHPLRSPLSRAAFGRSASQTTPLRGRGGLLASLVGEGFASLTDASHHD